VSKKVEEKAVWAVLPIKALRGAKERLADVLGVEERAGLATAMAQDMLASLTATAGVEGVLVVSNAEEVRVLAGQYGVKVLPESDGQGLSAAVTIAAQVLTREQVQAMMVVHGDIPLATPADFELVLDSAAPSPSITVVPCRNEDGSNVMICTPPDVIPFRYGPGSYNAHQRAARDAGIDAKILRVPGLALDIDIPEDLAALLQHLNSGKIGPNTERFLSERRLGEQL
jgi:2-phospho-L-lactate guanylyltransferase